MDSISREKTPPLGAKPSIEINKASSVDAIALLTAQHRDIDALFAQFAAAEESDFLTKEKTFAKIARQLEQHAQLEEAYFYPIVRRFDAVTVEKAEEDHSHMKLMVAKIDELSSEDEGFDANVLSLQELVRDHVEEEEGRIFPACQTKLSARTLRDLGTKMLAATKKAEAPRSGIDPSSSRQGETETGAKH